jgi:hypothetical protein
MLTTLAEALRRKGKRLILARASAEVRGLVRRDAAESEAVTVYASVDEALRAVADNSSKRAA